MSEDNYKTKYENLKREHDRLKEVFESNKEILVNNVHKIMNLEQDIEQDRFLTYGHFMWKLTKDELLYIRDTLLKNSHLEKIKGWAIMLNSPDFDDNDAGLVRDEMKKLIEEKKLIGDKNGN